MKYSSLILKVSFRKLFERRKNIEHIYVACGNQVEGVEYGRVFETDTDVAGHLVKKD